MDVVIFKQRLAGPVRLHNLSRPYTNFVVLEIDNDDIIP